ncbi:MAG: hypothetical protein EYC70_09380 [Planctomycetota bacterium]|nr:MAG: hypothetical protein EYC70_09380 [Planctomycetota bacterium]
MHHSFLLFSLLAAPAAQDFDGDGFADLAIGVQAEDLGAISGAGVVHVLYGSGAGVGTAGSQYLHQDAPGVKEAADSLDQFGQALAYGDFNGDGYDDLAVSAPSEDFGGAIDAGMVQVFFGTGAGLTHLGQQKLTLDTPGMPGTPQNGERFGWSLAAGDFDGDGFADLAVGAPYFDVQSASNAGRVCVLPGSVTGLDVVNGELWNRNELGATAGANDNFGAALASGDFDDDGYADLAIGAPEATVSGSLNAGLVQVMYGTASGLSSANTDLWHQGVAGVEGALEAGDRFGGALAAGDLDGDDVDDLAVGVQYEDVGSEAAAGAVNVFYGSILGLGSGGNQILHQDVANVESNALADERFGAAIAIADFDGDGAEDLAVGVSGEYFGALVYTGAVHVFYGDATGLSGLNEVFWTQDDTTASSPEEYDRFGASLAVGDYNASGYDDLVIGAPGESWGSAVSVGIVHVFYGGSATGADYLYQDTAGLADTTEPYDSFGSSLLR